jgi:hypothetical protein
MRSGEFEQEWLIPEPCMSHKEKIILGLISLGEFAQWLVVGVLLYLVTGVLPLDFIFKTTAAAVLLFSGVTFIHMPLNGLTGLEWIRVFFRYRLEEGEGLHHGKPSLPVAGYATVIAFSNGRINSQGFAENGHKPGSLPTTTD